jgi:hypothetical protein
MLKEKCFWTFILLIAAPGLSWAQGVCPLNGTGNHKLICMLPQALGSSGFNYAPFGILNDRPFPNIRPITQAVGARFSQLFRHLLATGNVLLKLNDSGLRAKAVPLAGISYSF